MATGDKLVTLDEIKEIYKHPLVVAITSGQWSGSGSDYYITVTASNVTADSILVPTYDNTSKSNLNGPVWCVPAAGSFTIHTSAVPSGTVNIMVQFPGVMGEANYQVLADVYSTSQTYSKTEAVAKADIVNNLTSMATDKPGSANMLRKLNSRIVTNELLFNTSTDVVSSSSVYLTCSEKLINFKLIIINFSTSSSNSSGTRGQLILPMVNQADARHFALQCGSTLGYIRLQVPSDSQSNLVVLSTGVFSHLYVTGIYGLFRISDE